MEVNLKLKSFNTLGEFLESKEQTGVVKYNYYSYDRHSITSKYTTEQDGILITRTMTPFYDFQEYKAISDRLDKSEIIAAYYPHYKVVFCNCNLNEYTDLEPELFKDYKIVKNAKELLEEKSNKYILDKFMNDIDRLNTIYESVKKDSSLIVENIRIINDIKRHGIPEEKPFSINCDFLDNIRCVDTAIEIYSNEDKLIEYCNSDYNNNEKKYLECYYHFMSYKKQLKSVLSKLENGDIDWLSKFIKIKEAVSNLDSRTLTVFLKNGKQVKVENKILLWDNEIFKSVSGRQYIEILDIDKITYNRNLIYQS